VASATAVSDCLARAFPGASTTSLRRTSRGAISAHRDHVHFPAWLALVIVIAVNVINVHRTRLISTLIGSGGSVNAFRGHRAQSATVGSEPVHNYRLMYGA
jgi:hypothetical protein